MRAFALSIVLGLALGSSACAGSTLRSGEPPGAAAPGYDEKWHAGFLFGTVRGSERYDLAQVCPEGWAEIRVEADPFTLLAGAVTLFIYSPSRVTIVCTRASGNEQLAF